MIEKRLKRPRDPVELGKLIGDILTGQVEDREPIRPEDRDKDQAAVSLVAIYFMHYNFVRIHQTLKITPAMAAGGAPKLWEMADMVKVLEEWEAAN